MSDFFITFSWFIYQFGKLGPRAVFESGKPFFSNEIVNE